MGMLSAIAIAERMKAGEMSVQEAITWHLRCNFRPPVHLDWIPICVSIVERVQSGDGDLTYKIDSPRRPEGSIDFVRADTVIDDLHLQPFVSTEVIDEDPPFEESS